MARQRGWRPRRPSQGQFTVKIERDKTAQGATDLAEHGRALHAERLDRRRRRRERAFDRRQASFRALSERRRDGGFRGLPVLRCESLTDARDASSDEVSSEDARQEETLIHATRWCLRQTSAPPGAPPPATRPHPLSPDALLSLLRSPPLSSALLRSPPSRWSDGTPPREEESDRLFSLARIYTYMWYCVRFRRRGGCTYALRESSPPNCGIIAQARVR